MSDALFGVAGNPPNFWGSAFARDRVNAIDWLADIGLDALEIQATRGIRMSQERAELFRERASMRSIHLSLHAPYYIALGNPDSGAILNTLGELTKSVQLAKWLGSTRIVFHLGALYLPREEARSLAVSTLNRLADMVDLGNVILYPEVIGRISQFGSLDDVLAICSQVKFCEPCVDFGHLHARTAGSLTDQSAFAHVFDQIVDVLGQSSLQRLHCHMYPIEWGPKGEIRHKAFSDKVESAQLDCVAPMELASYYHPRLEPFVAEVVRRQLSPIVICEAKDSQDVGAAAMKLLYRQLTPE